MLPVNYSLRQVADVLGVTPETLLWRHRHPRPEIKASIPPIKMIGGRWVINGEDLQAWLAAREAVRKATGRPGLRWLATTRIGRRRAVSQGHGAADAGSRGVNVL